MGNFSDLKAGLLAPALVAHLGDEVTHTPKVGAAQAEGIALSIRSRPEMDEDGDRWKYATGETAQFDLMPVKGDVILVVATGDRYIVNRAVDNGGVLEMKLEATTK